MTVTAAGQDWLGWTLTMGIITLAIVAVQIVDPFTYLARMVARSPNDENARRYASQKKIISHMTVASLVFHILAIIAYAIQAHTNLLGVRDNYSRDHDVMAIVLTSFLVNLGILIAKFRYNEVGRESDTEFISTTKNTPFPKTLYSWIYVGLLIIVIAPAGILYTGGAAAPGGNPPGLVYKMHLSASMLTVFAILLNLVNFKFVTGNIAEVDALLKLEGLKIDRTVDKNRLLSAVSKDATFKLPTTGSVDHAANVVQSVELKYASKVARDFGASRGITPDNLSVIQDSKGDPYIIGPVTESAVHGLIRPVIGTLLHDPMLKHSDFSQQFKGAHLEVGAPLSAIFMPNRYRDPFTAFVFQDMLMGTSDGLGVGVPFYSALSFLITLNTLANGIIMTHSAAAGFAIFFITGLGPLYYSYAGHTVNFLELYFQFQFFGWAIMYGCQFVAATGLYVFRGWTDNNPTPCYGCTACTYEDICPDMYWIAAFYLAMATAFCAILIVGVSVGRRATGGRFQVKGNP